jgi:hypothetical protein
MGGLTPKSGGRTLDNKIWNEFSRESKIEISLMNKL